MIRNFHLSAKQPIKCLGDLNKILVIFSKAKDHTVQVIMNLFLYLIGRLKSTWLEVGILLKAVMFLKLLMFSCLHC